MIMLHHFANIDNIVDMFAMLLAIRQIFNARIRAHTAENHWNVTDCAHIRFLVDAFFLYNRTFIY